MSRFALPTFVVLAVAIAALFAFAGSANAAQYSISNFTYNSYAEGLPNTTTYNQASGHPNVNIAFNRNGEESDDIKDIRLDLPTGVFANPEAANPKCTTAQFNGDSCPSSSNVGTVTTSVKALGLLDLDIAGSIDVITPDANQVATLGLTLRPEKICILFVFCAQPNKIFLKTGITIDSYGDSGLRTYTPGTPKTAVIGIPLLFVTPTITGDITINRLALNFQSRSGDQTTQRVCGGWFNMTCSNVPVAPAGPYFFRQTGSCVTATSNVEVTTYNGKSSSASASYTPTNCPGVSFNPSISFAPSNSTGNQPTPVTFGLSIPEDDAAIQQALPKIVDLDFPNGSGLNLDALSGVTSCTEDQLKARACPASSIIGSANAFSKYLPGATASTPGLAGNVYAMGAIGNQVPVGVQLVGPRDTIVIFRGTLGTRGDANAGTGRAYATFDRIPQLPYKSFSMTLSKALYKNPAVCSSAVTSASITGFNGNPNGTVVTRTAAYTPTNCSVAPQTTINSAPGSTTSDTTPPFTFSSSIAGSVFQCKIDRISAPASSGAYAPCSSPYTAEPLTDGQYTFSVKAINGATEDATPATATFTVATTGFTVTPTITVSDKQAAAHPDISTNFDVTGGQPRSISLKLPDGFDASLAARPLCSAADAAAGNCAAASKIGTAQMTVDTFPTPETGTGDVFLTASPTAADAGGISAKIQFSFGTFIEVGGAYLVENGKNQYLALRDIPQQVGNTAINVTNLKVNLTGASVSGQPPFLTNPSNCSTPASNGWISTAQDWSTPPNESQVFNVPFQATGCSTVAFQPTITQALSSPVAGTQTGVTANIALPSDNSAPVGNSTIKTVRVTEPPSLAPNFPSFGQTADQCPASSAPTAASVFDPTPCPAQAKVGTMQIVTPLLPTPLNADVYLIDRSPLPWLGVKFDSPGISVRLTGVTSTPQVDPNCDPLTSDLGYCQTQISIVFNNLPDVVLSGINFVLDGPNRTGVGNTTLSGKILKVAGPSDPTCINAGTTARAVFSPFTATANVTRTQNIPLSGCNQ